MPVPNSHSAFGGLEPVDEVDLSEAAPVVNIEDERDEAIPLMPARAKPPSLRPEESFADIDAELSSDRAPAAPVTPWRSVPALGSDATEKTPPRASLLSMDMNRDEEPEPTMVGRVPDNLLELSSGGGDENTRAFTAPRELIELARRKREERFESKAPTEEHVRDTQRPPAAPARSEAPPADEGFDEDADMAAPAVRADSAPPSAPPPPPRHEDDDAAPPVARTYSGEMEAVSMPRRQRESDSPAGSGPVIEVEPASELSLPRPPDENAVPSSVVASSGGSKAMSLQRVMVVVALCVVIGVVLARWRELVHLLNR